MDSSESRTMWAVTGAVGDVPSERLSTCGGCVGWPRAGCLDRLLATQLCVHCGVNGSTIGAESGAVMRDTRRCAGAPADQPAPSAPASQPYQPQQPYQPHAAAASGVGPAGSAPPHGAHAYGAAPAPAPRLTPEEARQIAQEAARRASESAAGRSQADWTWSRS